MVSLINTSATVVAKSCLLICKVLPIVMQDLATLLAEKEVIMEWGNTLLAAFANFKGFVALNTAVFLYLCPAFHR